MVELNLSQFSAEQIADWYFLTQISATDSASAGTAISTGYKTDDGNIAWVSGDPTTGALTTIAETLRAEAGYAIGVVSTVPFNHATPAAFVSHNVSRNNYAPGKLDSKNPAPSGYPADIATEILYQVQPEVVIGGGYGSSYVAGLNFNTLPADYVQVFKQAGVDGGTALAAAATTITDGNGDGQLDQKLLGLFGTSGGNFEYFTSADAPGNPAMTRGGASYAVTSDGIVSDGGIDPDPTLKEATLAALSVLNQDSDGFFVMFEQGDIDWSNHANDFASMVGGVADLDAAVRAAENFVGQVGDDIDWSNTLMIVTADHSNSYLRNQAVLGAGDLPTQLDSGGSSSYGSAWTYPDQEVTYQSGGHTSELVTLQARGAGAQLFADYTLFGDTVDNTRIYTVMKQAAAASGAEHVILFVGDGMNISHEVAGSRYLYGEDQALAWDDWGSLSDGWAGYATTWDVTTYNKYAAALGVGPYDAATFDPLVGYDPALGGEVPLQTQSSILQAVGKDVTLVGLADAGDVMMGSAGNDTLAGEMGNDIMLGGAGDDVLRGDQNVRFAQSNQFGGDDLIYGGAGNDRIGGKSGDDTLIGGLGNDQIWGDEGADLFVLAVGEGTDSFEDFTAGVDRIGLAGGLTFNGLSFAGNQILAGTEVLATLTGVDATTLTAAAFVTV